MADSTRPVLEARAPLWLAVSVAALGVVLLVLSLRLPLRGSTPEDIGYRIGTIIGTMAVWPLIVIGLFSIGKRWRTARVRLWILLVVWGLSVLGTIGRLNRQPRDARSRPVVPDVGESLQTEPAAGADKLVATEPGQPVLNSGRTSKELPEDFSRGSDERLIKAIEGARTEGYQSVAVAYAQACTMHPRDAQLALERVRFIDHFADAEDNPIEQAGTDHDAAVEYLTTHFPEAPGTILYQMGQAYGEEVEEKARAHEHQIARWPAEDRARFLLMRARAAAAREAPGWAQRYARESFQAHATVESGLLLANLLHTAGLDQECAEVLSHAVFTDAEPWTQKQRMDLLFDAGRADLALPLFKQLVATSPKLVRQTITAQRLIKGGLTGEARDLLAAIPLENWNRQAVLRTRFDFEMAHGDASQAVSAYRALRDTGYAADPFLRDRLALLRRHPAAGWALEDLAGLGGLVLLFGIVVLSPLLVILPVHYWSLLRERRGRTGDQPETVWGLRQAWLVMGLWLAAEAAGIWFWQPEAMQAWFDGKVPVPALTDQLLMNHELLTWGVQVLVMIIVLWRLKAWRMFGPGVWPPLRAVGLGLGLALAIRMALGVYVILWPGALGNDIAVVAQQKICMALLRLTGPVGMLAAVAGLVPVIEEFMFRGVLLQSLRKHVPFWAANLGQALLFALGHDNLPLLPFYLLMGVVCGVLARRSGGLLAPVVLHSANNMVATISLALQHG